MCLIVIVSVMVGWFDAVL